MQKTGLSTCIVTGGAGFIGSHLIEALLQDSSLKEVRIIDNFSSGRHEHLIESKQDARVKVIELDLLDLEAIVPYFSGADFVYHLAANPDARWGIDNTRLDLEQETLVTYNVLEAMRRSGVKRILLSSSGTVYGDVGTAVTHETLGPALPVSLYGAGKVASEALVSAFCGTFNFSATLLRFGNIVGERTTHGVIYDFIRKLATNPEELQVLGNGFQSKPYVYVKDLIDVLVFAGSKTCSYPAKICEVFNVAPTDHTSVRFIAETLLDRLKLTHHTQIHYGDTEGGWPGDVAQSRMDSSKLEKFGCKLKRGSNEAVIAAIEGIVGWLSTRENSDDQLTLPRVKS